MDLSFVLSDADRDELLRLRERNLRAEGAFADEDLREVSFADAAVGDATPTREMGSFAVSFTSEVGVHARAATPTREMGSFAGAACPTS